MIPDNRLPKNFFYKGSILIDIHGPLFTYTTTITILIVKFTQLFLSLMLGCNKV